mmetsp:Transcript_7176/g.15468  ORF Transcript_7176/g.15468 Transcript_7176/m.15468 type:complete len:593 (-) Transcript_7176:32-1810(-)
MIARHKEALSTFEENDEFDVIQSKLLQSKKLQKEQTITTTELFCWLHEKRKIEKEVDAITNQTENCLSNAIKAIKKGKDAQEKVFKFCGIDISSSSNAIASLKENLLTIKTHHLQAANFDRATSIVAAVENDVASLKTYDSNNSTSNKISTCAQIISDAKNELAKIDEKLHEEYCVQSSLLNEQRRSIMAIITSDMKQTTENNSDEADLTSKLSQRIQALRQNVYHRGQVDDYEIDLLEYELTKEFRNAKASYDDEVKKLNNYDRVGSWDEISESIFKSTLSLCAGKSQTSLVSRLKNELPDKSMDEIMDHLTSHSDKKSMKRKMKIAADVFRKQQGDIERKGLKTIEQIQREMMERSKREEETIRFELKRKKIDLHLMELRRMRSDTDRNELNQKVQTEMTKRTNGIEKEVNLMVRRLEAKKGIWKHQNEALEEQVEIILGNNLGAELNCMQRKKSNSKRIVYRQGKEKEKLITRMKAEEEALRDEEKRLGRLNSLAASVPYYGTIMKANSDILKSTESRKNDIYQGRSELADFQSGNLKSFTNEQLFSDSRFRLGNALHAAGLARTEYARDVVRDAIPRCEERTTGIKPY